MSCPKKILKYLLNGQEDTFVTFLISNLIIYILKVKRLKVIFFDWYTELSKRVSHNIALHMDALIDILLLSAIESEENIILITLGTFVRICQVHRAHTSWVFLSHSLMKYFIIYFYRLYNNLLKPKFCIQFFS